MTIIMPSETQRFATRTLRYGDRECLGELDNAIAALNRAWSWAGDERGAIKDAITELECIKEDITG